MLALTPTVLVVDDDPDMRTMLEAHLGRRGLAVITCASAPEALELTAAHAPDVVVADIHMRDLDGIELCQRLRAVRPRMPVILITSFGSMETAILAIRAGAVDFLPKPFRIEQLLAAIERHVAPRAREHHGLLGDSSAMRELHTLIAKLAASDAPVLIGGESGTGKELIARALHAAGPRARGPLVAINCAAMPAALLESELFGHARGAFTDARGAKRGLFEAANGGTLFLDEIGDLPLEIQPKLLRALQQRTVRPVGSTEEIPFDARLVTATNRDLARMVATQQFRGDLFFRIHVVQIAVPPLRARGDDILLLARHFLTATGSRRDLSPEAERALVSHSWPGNVRELENAVAHALALASGEQIELADLPLSLRSPHRATLLTDDDETLEVHERRHIERVLDGVNGNKTKAARALGIERKTLYRMLERWRS